MIKINELKKTKELPNIIEFRQGFLEILNQCTNKLIENKEIFTIDNFSYIYFDEYSLETNCNNDTISNIYLIINQPNNIKLNKITNKKSKKITVPEMYFSLDKVRDELFDQLTQLLDSNNLIWKTNYSVSVKSTVYDKVFGINNYYFNIIPCITYYDKNNIEGVMYYYNNGTQIEYPELAIQNYLSKNQLTDDIFRQIIVIFKNILLSNKDISDVPSEIIETVLYNVPTEMFINDSKDTLINIINYLRNFSVKDFVTLDEQDFAFTSIYRAMSPFYVKHILKIIEKNLLSN